jgi:hypothetical protein
MLRLYFRNLRGCNVGITDGKYLGIMPLRWGQVPISIKIGSDIHLIEGYTYRHTHTDIKVIPYVYFLPNKECGLATRISCSQ